MPCVAVMSVPADALPTQLGRRTHFSLASASVHTSEILGPVWRTERLCARVHTVCLLSFIHNNNQQRRERRRSERKKTGQIARSEKHITLLFLFAAPPWPKQSRAAANFHLYISPLFGTPRSDAHCCVYTKRRQFLASSGPLLSTSITYPTYRHYFPQSMGLVSVTNAIHTRAEKKIYILYRMRPFIPRALDSEWVTELEQWTKMLPIVCSHSHIISWWRNTFSFYPFLYCFKCYDVIIFYLLQPKTEEEEEKKCSVIVVGHRCIPCILHI